MLTDANMRDNGDGTVSFEFRMNADDITEIAVLKKMMSDYRRCVEVLREYYMEMEGELHTCEVCGSPATVSHATVDGDTGAMDGPHYLCDKCGREKGVTKDAMAIFERMTDE